LLARNFTFKVSSQLLAALLAFVSMLIMTRYIANEYGVMMWGLALISLVNTVADLGFNSANLKFIAKEGYDKQACFSTFMVVKLILTGLMVVITLVTLFIMRTTDAIDDEAVGVCLMFIVYQVISNVQFAIYYTLDGLMKSGRSSILTIVECSIRNTILIIMALMYVGPITLSSAYVIATSISVVVSIFLIWKEGMRPVKPKYLKEYVVFAAPLAAALILTSVVSNLDKVIVGLFYESIEVTYYSTAIGTIATFTAIGVSLNTVLLPHLSKNVEDTYQTQTTIWNLERLLCTLLLPVIAWFIILGPQIAAVLFGDAMRPSGSMIAILAVHVIPFVFAGLMTQILYAVNRGKAYLRASVVLCLSAVIGFALLIPNTGIMPFDFDYGGIGAALAVVIAYTLFFVVLAAMVKSYTGFKLYPRLWKIAIAFALIIGLLILEDKVFFIDGVVMLAISGLSCEFAFLAILFLMRELKVKYVVSIWKKLRDDND